MKIEVFVPSRGFLFFYKYERRYSHEKSGFRPLTGISLFLCFAQILFLISIDNRFRPLTGISLFLSIVGKTSKNLRSRFRPLTGISLFLYYSFKFQLNRL